jgi:hypothetical protein
MRWCSFIQKNIEDLKLLLFQALDELIAVTGYPLASLLDDGEGIFLSFGCDEEFRIRELELNHIAGDINIGIS